jgi:hypothetical protein
LIHYFILLLKNVLLKNDEQYLDYEKFGEHQKKEKAKAL